jgi:hypothetical protein
MQNLVVELVEVIQQYQQTLLQGLQFMVVVVVDKVVEQLLQH